MYDRLVDGEFPRHWWNGKWGRSGRRDVYLREEQGRFVVEARAGGADGRSMKWEQPTEQEALRYAETLLSDQDGWRELTVRP